MPFRAAPCRITDGHAVAVTLLSAYRGDPFTDCLYPNISFEERVAGNTGRFPRNFLRNKQHRHMKIVDETSGELVGYAKWALPELEKSDRKEHSKIWDSQSNEWYATPTEEELVAVGDVEALWRAHVVDGDTKGFNAEGGAIVGPGLMAGRESTMGGRACLILELLATHPQWQRQGIARQLLLWGMDIADELQLPIYLDATPAGRALYEAEGFSEVGSVVHDLGRIGGEGEYIHAFMIREPVLRA